MQQRIKNGDSSDINPPQEACRIHDDLRTALVLAGKPSQVRDSSIFAVVLESLASDPAES
jgi:hypothetical protein